MKIIETRVMRGPNQWSSTQKQLIVLKVACEEPGEELFADVLAQVTQAFPGLASQQVPEQAAISGLVQIIQHVATNLQTAAGMPCIYSRAKITGTPGVYFVIYSYEIEQAGEYAGRAAVKLLDAYLHGNSYDVQSDLEELKRLRAKYNIGPTSNYLLDEIKRRHIPFRRFDYGSLLTIGYGNRQRKIRTAVTDSTSGLGIELAGDKDETKKLLMESNVPVPQGILVYSEKELVERIREVSYPLVVKPLDGNHGRGVTTEIYDLEKAKYGFEIAKKISNVVIVEEFIKGEDYRFLVINFKLVAVAKRTPALVIGDGRSTIQQLIETENLHHERGTTYEHVLAPIKIDATTHKILNEKNLTLSSVLPAGQILVVKDTANISAGGTAEDVTDLVHPYNVFMVERIARMFNLNICGVDIMTTAVDIPITREVGAVIEVNAGPGLRMHSNPQKGTPRNIASPIIDMLFPESEPSRIPIIAVTGTNGKTTTTRLIAHLAMEAGHTPGFCTTDGIYCNGYLLNKGDCTGSVSAQNVLFDPSIDFAVLECARGGIIRSGLGFDESDVAVITNITEDHLGLKDIFTVEELAKVKCVVARTVKKDGYVVLNADDDRVYGLREELTCKIALFSLNASSERIRAHVENNGLAAVIDSGYITILNEGNKIMVERIDRVPLSFDGKAAFMISNILASALAAYAVGLDTSAIKKGLVSFKPSPELTPGRMNRFDFKDFTALVDYAHNTDGFMQIQKFLRQVNATSKTAIIAVAGDRREEDIRRIGKIVAETFDNIILRYNRESRGFGQERVNQLLQEGIKLSGKQVSVKNIQEEKSAIEYALGHAEKGSYIFICADKVPQTLEYVEEYYHGASIKKAV